MTMLKSCAPLILIALVASNPLAAHHAFSTEFDPDLVGEVEGPVTEVLWANPHVRYGVEINLEDGSTEVWYLQPPGNLPSYRRENWFEDTVQVGDHVRATGNLARGGLNKLHADCI